MHSHQISQTNSNNLNSTQSYTQSNNSSLLHSQINTNTQLPLKIGSLNTRGLNDNTKLKCLLDYTVNNNYSIFGLSETKIKESSQIYYKTDDYITQ